MKNAYEILGVAKSADSAAIRAAYRQKAKQHHPDLSPHDPAAHERFLELKVAYEILSDPERRALYHLDPTGVFESELEQTKRRSQIKRRRRRLMKLYEESR